MPTKSVPYVSAFKCAPLLRAAAARGADPAALYAVAGLEPGADFEPERRIEAGRYLALWDACLDATAEPALPLYVARTPVDALGLFGFVVATSATVGDALRRGIRWQRLMMSEGGWRLARERERAQLTFEPWHGGASGRAACAANEAAVGAMLFGMQALAGAVEPSWVGFAHGPPADPAPYARELGRRPEFGAAHYGLTFAASTLDRPLVTSFPALSEYLERQCSELLARHGGDSSVVSRARSLLARGLTGPPASMASLARALGMSPRTLRRHLEAEGSSFLALRDEVRAALATSHLADGKRSVSEVAALTGFESLSAFHRAFRRWTGQAPGDFAASTSSPTRESGRLPVAFASRAACPRRRRAGVYARDPRREGRAPVTVESGHLPLRPAR